MRCHVCDAVLAGEEVIYDPRYANEKYGPYQPCTTCMIEILEEVPQDDEFVSDDDVYILSFLSDVDFP